MKTSIDILFTGGKVFNPFLKQFMPFDVAVTEGKILYAGPSLPDAFTAKEIRDITGKYLIPGLVDSHMHIQSSMMIPRTFSDAVIPHGVTTVISEPHEIANVFGLAGVEASLADAEGCDLDIRLAMPSSVPSTREDLETTGAVIDIPDIDAMMKLPRTVCLGEVMNVHDVIYDKDCKSNRIIRYVMDHEPLWPIEGHCPRVTGLELATFIYRGVTSDHTEQAMESMKQRLMNGVFVQLQGKSLHWDLLTYIDEAGLEDRLAFVTDDTMPDVLWRKGHLDQILRKAMELGFPPEKAIYCATWTPSQRMRLFDRGAILPGRIADLVVLEDLKTFSVESVYKEGRLVFPAADKKAERPLPYPDEYYHSVHVKPVTEDAFRVPAPIQEGTVTCRVAFMKDGTTMTTEGTADFPVRGGYIQWEETPYALACVMERHGKGGGKGFLFTGGIMMKEGAAATTYAHDSHNLLVLGQNGADMARAANDVIEKQGGMSVVKDGAVTGSVRLPVAGILSDQPVSVLGAEVESVKEALTAIGYTHSNLIMSMTTLALPVSPALKVTDKGVVDVKQMKLVPLVVEAREK